MTDDQIAYTDLQYRRRVLTLLSVDDLVGAIVNEIHTLGLTNNTYIFYTADNGYHTGQFGIMKDKGLPYEMDVRLPGYVRGPTVKAGSKLETAVLNIDFAPTFLELAGLGPTEDRYLSGPTTSMDGRSFAGAVLHGPGIREERTFLLEYNGEGDAQYGMFCDSVGGEMDAVEPKWNRPPVFSCQDATNNTYRCVRKLGPQVDALFCIFPMEDGFTEYYPDMRADPWQLRNLAHALPAAEAHAWKATVASFAACSGKTCRPVSSVEWTRAEPVDALEHLLWA